LKERTGAKLKQKSKKKTKGLPKPQKGAPKRIIDPRFHNLIVIGIFALLTIILFREALFNTSLMLYGTDAIARIFWDTFYSNFWRTYHTLPLWDPYIHGGMPFVDGMHGDIFYPTTVLKPLLGQDLVPYTMGLKVIIHVFLAGVFMFFFLRSLNLRVVVSFLGGLLYMFSPCLVSLVYPGHDGKMFVIALTPLAFLVLNRACKSGRLLHFLLFSLTLGLLIFSAHVQMAYFACWGLGLFFLFQIWNIHRKGNEKIFKYVAYFLISIILGLSLSIVQMLSPYLYIRTDSMRTMHTGETGGYEYAASWSMHWEELASEIVPEFSGDNVQGQGNSYWGRNPFKLNSEYVGLLALFLAVVTVIYRRSRLIWFFLALGGLALIYALGATTPLFRIFYYLVPGVKNFRAPSMINFLFCFATVTIAMLGLERLFGLKDRPDGAERFLKIALIFVIAYSGIAVLITLLGRSFFSIWIAIFYSGIEPEKMTTLGLNLPRVIGGLWISTLLLWLGYGVLRLHLRGTLKEVAVVGALAIIALVDLFRFDSRFILTVNPDEYYGKSSVVDFLKERQKEEPFRVFLAPKSYPDNYLAYHGIEEVSLTAMHGNHLRLYDEFVGRHEKNPNLTIPNIMNLLNVKYVVSRTPLDTPWAKKVLEGTGMYVYENLDYLPRAFPVYSWEVEEDQSKVLSELKDSRFDIRQKILLAEALPGIGSSTTDASPHPLVPARVYDYRINSFKVDVDMQQDGFLFLSENYYPAWKAYADGKETKIYKADYLFRAVYLDKGKHQVEFVFDSAWYDVAKNLSLLTLLGLLVIFGLYLVRGRVSKKAVRM
jgi:hypothetical protein